MEGYLVLITKGFTGLKLRKVWVVLDRQQLTWYDHLDLTEQLPKKLKGVLFIRDAAIKKITDSAATHALQIICNDVKTMFGCENETVCSSWYKALTKALPMHTQEALKAALPKQYMSTLELDWDEKLTKAAIAKAYKRLCLKEHPDKGGDVEKFNQINTAYNYLVAMQAAQDELESTVPLQYEATLRKLGGKLGLCLSVNEDRINDRLLVGRVQDEIEIVEIDDEAGGCIKPGDRIIGIDHDDCSHWSLSRLLPRLGPVRIPLGGTVVFTFERRVAPDEGDDDDDYSDLSPQPSPVPTTIIRTNIKTASNEQKNGDGAPPLTPKTAHSDESSGNMSPINPVETTHNAANPPVISVPTAVPSNNGETTRDSFGAAAASKHSAVPQEVLAPLSMPTVSSVSTPVTPAPCTPTPQSHAPESASTVPTPAEARAAALARRKQRLAEESAAAEPAPMILLMPTIVPEEAPAFVPIAPFSPPYAPVEGSVLSMEQSPPPRLQSVAVPIVPVVLQQAPPEVMTEVAVAQKAQSQMAAADPRVTAQRSAVQRRSVSPPPSPPPPPPPAVQEKLYPLQEEMPSVDDSVPPSPPYSKEPSPLMSKPFRQLIVEHANSSAWAQQRQIYESRLQAVQAQLDEALAAVRNQALKIDSLQAENGNLTETVTSLARFMDRRQLENPEMRTGHILELQQSLSAANASVAHLQAQLADRSADNSDNRNNTAVQAFVDLQKTVYQEQTDQAQRVEHLLMNAIMNISKS